MRGKLGRYAESARDYGITPAGAGKTLWEKPGLRLLWDHPPRMRGKPIVGDILIFSVRITPADAGKTIIRILSGNKLQDHPRGCGENAPQNL